MRIGNVENLLPDEVALTEESDKQTSEEGKPTTAGGTSTAASSPAKSSGSGVWWDRDVEVNAAKRAATTVHAAQVKAVQKAKTDLDDAIRDAGAFCEDTVAGVDSEYYDELKIAQARQAAIDKILNATPEELKQYIAEIARNAHAMGGGSLDPSRSPPCRHFTKLITLAELAE
eukprot:15453547-Alexandrium_andersonii.AAC.1